jgi:(p)ppGpp synthase/HD superfamily hydrolase
MSSKQNEGKIEANKKRREGEISIARAKSFAVRKHAGQVDDDGRPYFEAHLAPVAKVLMCVTDDIEIVMAGYLHDTLEDTGTTYQELVDNFGTRVADLVNEVTHEGKKDENGYYFPRLKTREGIALKFADRLSNLFRISSWDEKRIDQYIRKSKFWKSELSSPIEVGKELSVRELEYIEFCVEQDDVTEMNSTTDLIKQKKRVLSKLQSMIKKKK